MVTARGPLATPARIAVAGDWGGSLSYGTSAIWHAMDHGADLVMHVGDFAGRFRPRYLQGLCDALAFAELQLVFVDGNHDDHQYLASLPRHANGLRQVADRIWHCPRGFRWTWEGVRFVGLGGAHSVDGMARRQRGWLWQPEETITPAQAADVAAAGPADVMFTHDCPDGVDIPGLDPSKFPLIELLRAEEHRQVLRQVVDAVQPAAIWHGHYHVRYQAQPDFGYGPVQVTGLSDNTRSATLADNVAVVDLDQLQHLARRLP